MCIIFTIIFVYACCISVKSVEVYKYSETKITQGHSGSTLNLELHNAASNTVYIGNEAIPWPFSKRII